MSYHSCSPARCRIRVSIDGNIGSGKTTQLKLLEKIHIVTRREPIEEWPLERFYSDPKRWGFLLQMSVLASFADPRIGEPDIWERSPESSREIFWRGGSCPEEDEVYARNYSIIGWEPDIVVYLKTDPDECYERCLSRHQTGDTSVTREYIHELHNRYERYVTSRPHVYTIDGSSSRTPEEIHVDIVECLLDVLG